MAKLLFHIGSPKTGSSAIQNALQLTRSILRASGVDVPDHKFLIQDSAQDSGNAEWLANFCTGIWPAASAKGQATCKAFSKILEPQENLIFSSENFYYSTEEALRFLSIGLLERYDEVGLVLYLRHPADMCHSLWMQGVKRTDSKSVSLIDFANEFVFDPEQVIKRFDDAFNKVTKFIISYDSIADDVVPTFFLTIKKFFNLEENYAGEYYDMSINSRYGSREINRSLNSSELIFFQNLTTFLCANKVPVENIISVKRQCSDILLAKGFVGEEVVCPEEIVNIVSMKAQSALKYLVNDYGVTLSRRKVSLCGAKTFGDRSESALTMAKIVGHFASRIPPSLPVIHLRTGDNFEFDGYIDQSSSVFVSGWMVCKSFPMSSVLVLISVGRFEYTLLANNFRSDVVESNPEYSPYCGYYYEFDSEAAAIIRRGEIVKVSVFGG
jgi:hypothetical protein